MFVPIFNKKTKQPLLLNKINGAVVPLSFRKLYKNYNGPCIKVRRSSDNTETDIYFVNNALDTASLLAFVGSNSGYVSVIYDPSGKGNNAIQANAVNQPRIINSGTLDTVNGKPALYFDGIASNIEIAHSASINLQSYSVSMVTKPTRAAGAQIEPLFAKQLSLGNTKGFSANLRTSNPYVRMVNYGTSLFITNGTPPDPRDGNNHNLSFIKNAGNCKIYENGINYVNETLTDQDVTNTEPLILGFNSNASMYYQGYIQEFILFSSDITNNVAQIYQSAKSYYGVV